MKSALNKFLQETISYQIRWHNIEKSPNYEQTVMTALTEIVKKICDDGKPEDMLSCVIDHPALDNSINIPYCPQNQFTASKLRYEIYRRQQSKKEFNFDSKMDMIFTRSVVPIGGRPMQK